MSKHRKRLLTIVVPTYNRVGYLTRCVGSVVREITAWGFEEKVELLISNNCSPDDTFEFLQGLKAKPYVRIIHRGENIGLVMNVIAASEEAQAEYFMWLSDDDWLPEGGLKNLVSALECLSEGVGYLWCPLPTYDDRNGQLFTVPSKSFDSDTLLEAGLDASVTHMNVGWALSRQVFRRASFDYAFARDVKDNSYFPLAIAARTMLRNGSLYLDKPYVQHTYFNQEHWEEWGSSRAMIELRLFIDRITAVHLPFYDVELEHRHVRQLLLYQLQEVQSYMCAGGPVEKLIKSFGAEAAARHLIVRSCFNDRLFVLLRARLPDIRPDFLGVFEQEYRRFGI